jgi:NAD+ diphosphatase
MAGNSSSWSFPKQHFTGNPLDRTSDNRRRFQADQRPDDEISLVVVAGREICVRNAVASQQDLQALLLKMDDPDLQLQTEQLCMTWSSGGCRGRPLAACARRGGVCCQRVAGAAR